MPAVTSILGLAPTIPNGARTHKMRGCILFLLSTLTAMRAVLCDADKELFPWR